MTQQRITYPVLTDPNNWEDGNDYELTDFGSAKTPIGVYSIYSGNHCTELLFNKEKFLGVAGATTDDIITFIRKQAHRDMLKRLDEKIDPIDDEEFTVARWDIN